MKTAIQNLYNEMISDPKFIDLPMDFIQSITSKFSKAMDEEKQQIIDAVTFGNRMEFYDVSETAGEQYYTSTFTTNKETLK